MSKTILCQPRSIKLEPWIRFPQCTVRLSRCYDIKISTVYCAKPTNLLGNLKLVLEKHFLFVFFDAKLSS